MLGPALLNSPIGLEKIEILDENHVNAEVRLRFAFVTLTTRLMMVFMELREPERMVVDLNAEALWGLVRLRQRIIFDLNSQDDNHTEVICKSLAEKNNPILFRIIARKAQRVAETTLTGVEETLKRLA